MHVNDNVESSVSSQSNLLLQAFPAQSHRIFERHTDGKLEFHVGRENDSGRHQPIDSADEILSKCAQC